MITGWILNPASKRFIAMMAIVSCAVRLLFAVISTKIFFTSVLILVALLFTIGGKDRTVLFESTIIGYLSLSFTICPYSNPVSNSSRICTIVYFSSLPRGAKEKFLSTEVYASG